MSSREWFLVLALLQLALAPFPPAVASPCVPPVGNSDIFLFEDSASLLLTDYSDSDYLALQVAAANALIAQHGDNFETLVFWTNFTLHHQGGVAVYDRVRNDVSGLGISLQNNSVPIGLNSDRAEGFVTMYNINSSLFAAGSGTFESETTQSVLTHEFEHQFGLQLPDLVDGRRLRSGTGCGPSNANHWSSQVDLNGGSLTAVDWIGSSPAIRGGDCINPDGVSNCRNTDTGTWTSYLDLYLMGYVSPATLDSATGGIRYLNDSCSDPYNGLISTFGSAEIIASAGERIPGSLTAKKHYRAAWIMIHLPGAPPSVTELNKASGIATEFSNTWATNTLGSGTLNNALDTDCNCNGVPDAQDILSLTSLDCDANGVPDECDPDCDGNGIPDACDIALGTHTDCNGDEVPDVCDLSLGETVLLSETFDAGVPASWSSGGSFHVTSSCGGEPASDCGTGPWMYAGSSTTCRHLTGDAAELVLPLLTLPEASSRLEFCSRLEAGSGHAAKIRVNGEVIWEQTGGSGLWVTETLNLNAYLGQSVRVSFEFSGLSVSNKLGWQVDNVELVGGDNDCNTNSVPDACDIDLGTSTDCNANNIPDECESGPDCNSNGIPDALDICFGTSVDCNDNGIPDECDVLAMGDCNNNGIPDDCELDCNNNNVPDVCDISQSISTDCNNNAIPDECEFVMTPEVAVYPIELSNLVNVPSFCPTGPFTCDSESPPGIMWADTLSGSLLSVEVEFALGLNCPPAPSRTHSLEFNAMFADSLFDGAPMCPCGIGTASTVIATLPQSLYQFGQTNVLTIKDVANCLGFADQSGLAGQFGEIRVVYLPFAPDCNTNGIPDFCDIIDATSADVNANGVPDECESVTGTEPTLPAAMSLSVFPVPSRGPVTLRVEMPKHTVANLTVFDVRGRKVKTLIAEHLEPGRYSIPWDGRDNQSRRVASGVYYVRLESPDGTQATRITIYR